MTIASIVILAAIFMAVVMGTLAIGALFQPRHAEERLRRMVTPDRPRGTGNWFAGLQRRLESAEQLAKLAQPDENLSEYRTLLARAGFPSGGAVVALHSLRAVLTLGLPVLLVTLVITVFRGISLPQIAVVALLGAASGYYLPVWVVRSLARRRQREVFEGLPVALDLLTVCVEAGVSLDAAIPRVAQDIAILSPTIAAEFNACAREIRAGAAREVALRHLVTRSGLDDMESLVSVLIQADRFGTSIADALRVQADMLRNRRQNLAEEQAATIPLRMLFPLLFCVFPGLILVLLGPAVIRIYRTLLPAMGGG